MVLEFVTYFFIFRLNSPMNNLSLSQVCQRNFNDMTPTDCNIANNGSISRFTPNTVNCVLSSPNQFTKRPHNMSSQESLYNGRFH